MRRSEQHTFTWSIDRPTWVVWSDGPSRSPLRTGRSDREARRPRRVVSLLRGGGSRSETFQPPAATVWRARSLTDQDDRRVGGSIDRDRRRSESRRPFRRLIYAASETPRPGHALVYRRLSIHAHAVELTDQPTSFLNEGVRGLHAPTAAAGRAAARPGGWR